MTILPDCGKKISEKLDADDFIENSIRQIRETIGDSAAIVGVSGGVDSTVAAVLVHKAIGDRLHPIMVDHGLLRQGEVESVVEPLRKLGIEVCVVDAQDRFLDKLSGVTDPELKRKIIGEEFIRVFEEQARKWKDAHFLVQGTIYPDVIESGGSRAKGGGQLIKSHHNVGGLPDDIQFELVEPLRELYKDEVRIVGESLGLPKELLHRHAFPGPGLAVRVLGEVTRERLDIVRRAQKVLDEEIRSAGLYDELWQCFCVLPDVKTVGVRDGGRTYGYMIGIRAVVSQDAMTAEWARIPHELLNSIADRIVREVDQVNRIVYDITSKPPATIEWE